MQLSEEVWLDRRVHLAISLPFLSMVAPFVVYLTNQEYSLMSLQVWLILAGMFCISAVIGWLRCAGATRMYAISVSCLFMVAMDYLVKWVADGRVIALLVIFGVLVFLVRRFERTTTLAMTAFLCVFIISTLLQKGLEAKPGYILAASDMDAATKPPPRLLHLILDEHLGIEGFPDDTDYAKELKRKIKQFYQRYGFELYGGAYSHYFQTIDAIPNLVNFSAENVSEVYATSERPPYPLQQNRYFQFLKNKGYQIHVLDGNFIDFCSSLDVRPQSCTKYQWHTWGKVAELDLPRLTKTATLLATFAGSYPRYRGVRYLYDQRMRPFLLSQGVVIPVLDRESLWTGQRLQPYSVNAMAAMDALSMRSAQLARGHTLFAHLLLPHFPYVYREDCSPRELSESLNNMERIPLELRTTEDRAVRFTQYLRQVECLYTKLDELFQRMQASGVFDDSIIIVQGDHGARLGLRDPQLKEQDQLTAADYVDGLSTLFAAKAPGTPGGYDPSLRAINQLFVQTLGNALGKPPSLSVPREEPFAYLYNGRQKELLLVDMPWRPRNLPDNRATVR